MKAILTKKNLLQGIRTASHAITSRPTLFVLGHVLLSSEEAAIRISGTDLETGISTVIPAQVLTPGKVTLPASVAAEIAGLLPDGSVALEQDGSLIRISSSPAEFSLVGLPPDEFPDLPEVPEDVWFEMEAGQLRAALRRTVSACSTDELYPVLCGVMFVFLGDTLKLVATDTHRLAVDTQAVPAGSGQARAVVPLRALRGLLKIMPGQGSVRVHISERQIMFRWPEATLVAALIERQFPDYERVIPTDFDRRWVIHPEPLAAALRRAEIVAQEDMQRVVLRFRGGKVAISARSGDVGEAHDEVDAVRERGDDLEIAFNCGYLLDVLNVIETDGLAFEMSEPLSPAVLRPEGEDDYLCVVMPMEKPGEEEA